MKCSGHTNPSMFTSVVYNIFSNKYIHVLCINHTHMVHSQRIHASQESIGKSNDNYERVLQLGSKARFS